MSDSDKSKKQLIEELKALRGQAEVRDGETGKTRASGITRREVLSGWVAPVILTVPLLPRISRAQASGSVPEVDFAAFPTRLSLDAGGNVKSKNGGANELQGNTSPSPTSQAPGTSTPGTSSPTYSWTSQPTSPTSQPTSPTSFPPTFVPTASPTITIPVELTDFEVNG